MILSCEKLFNDFFLVGSQLPKSQSIMRQELLFNHFSGWFPVLQVKVEFPEIIDLKNNCMSKGMANSPSKPPAHGKTHSKAWGFCGTPDFQTYLEMGKMGKIW